MNPHISHKHIGDSLYSTNEFFYVHNLQIILERFYCTYIYVLIHIMYVCIYTYISYIKFAIFAVQQNAK